MEDLTTGSLSRHLLRTASFMLVTMLSQTLYLLVDLYWVGSLGKEAVAAVGLAANLSFVVLALSQVLGVGTTTLISHASGARDRSRAREVFHQSLWLACAAAVAFLVIAWPGRRLYVDAFAADVLTATLGEDYLRWFVPALALQFVLATMAAALRGTGAFKAPMLVQVMTVVINIVLAPVLIFGWGLGVTIGVVRRGHRLAGRRGGRHRVAVAGVRGRGSVPAHPRRGGRAPARGCGARSWRSACRPGPSSA